ncbi:hypothetical protein JCM19037_305 [Geomicrobium sp. JCM 19037]|uniref:response regulator aspartate phosphatase n=1 Tax=unclassified Geomicrobium TaxID=2628951 RepID=UPI00045F2C1A|nr:hypothetical protein [Geomicrobium sp. JCM 19037]GAK02099.1 hypothetical protein JCM19037_305 [Geomicrobium sp. JCM 19037]
MNNPFETEVLTQIGEWFINLSHYELKEARKTKSQVDQYMCLGTVSKKVRCYYDLVNFKHQILNEEISFRPDLQRSIEMKQDVLELTDKTLTYLYYFMQAIVASNTEDYFEALQSLRKAENYMKHVNAYERAEFFFRKAFVYYRLDQNISALHNVDRSYELIKVSGCHDKLKANLNILKSGIYSEAGDHASANAYAEQGILHANHEPLTKAMAIRSKANNEFRFKNFEKAAELYEWSLRTGDQRMRTVGVKTSFNLAYALLKLGKYEKGKQLLDEVEKSLIDQPEGLLEYVSRSLIARELYVSDKPSHQAIEKALKLLQRKNLRFELKEVTKELSDYYIHHKDYVTAHHYLSWSFETNVNEINIGGKV